MINIMNINVLIQAIVRLRLNVRIGRLLLQVCETQITIDICCQTLNVGTSRPFSVAIGIVRSIHKKSRGV